TVPERDREYRLPPELHAAASFRLRGRWAASEHLDLPSATHGSRKSLSLLATLVNRARPAGRSDARTGVGQRTGARRAGDHVRAHCRVADRVTPVDQSFLVSRFELREAGGGPGELRRCGVGDLERVGEGKVGEVTPDAPVGALAEPRYESTDDLTLAESSH